MTGAGRDSTDTPPEPATTSEPVKVEWKAPVGGKQSVTVDPYAATIVYNGREFSLSALASDDLPSWMYDEVEP